MESRNLRIWGSVASATVTIIGLGGLPDDVRGWGKFFDFMVKMINHDIARWVFVIAGLGILYFLNTRWPHRKAAHAIETTVAPAALPPSEPIASFQPPTIRDAGEEPPTKLDPQKIKKAKNDVHGAIIERLAERPRLDHFYNLSRSEDQRDSLYREAIESFMDDETWYFAAHAVDYWVSLGFEALVKWQSAHLQAKEGTLNQLFQAAFKELSAERFPIEDGQKFAQAVRDVVIDRRRKMQ